MILPLRLVMNECLRGKSKPRQEMSCLPRSTPSVAS
jgi:hypothetical protein